MTMLTFNAESQGLAGFQLKDLDDTQRRSMFQDSFDDDLRIAATQHYEADERIEREREDETFAPPEAFNQSFSGYNVRPTKSSRITPKEPEGPPPSHLRRPAEPALPPDVRDRPANAEAVGPPMPDFEPRTRGRWRWSRRNGDWEWEQNYDPNEENWYSPNYRPDADQLLDWMGRGWVDHTNRFGFRSM